MSKVRAENYERARELIKAGTWRADPDAGLVYGRKGKPFCRTNSCGYIQIKYRDPHNPRAELAAVAHRVIWEAEHGPLPEHLTVNHLNGVKTDNRIANLEAVTWASNNRHAYRTGLNPRWSSRVNAQLTSEQARDVYRRAWAGESHRAIGADYGISRKVVSQVKRGWVWTDVTGHVRHAA